MLGMCVSDRNAAGQPVFMLQQLRFEGWTHGSTAIQARFGLPFKMHMLVLHCTVAWPIRGQVWQPANPITVVYARVPGPNLLSACAAHNLPNHCTGTLGMLHHNIVLLFDHVLQAPHGGPCFVMQVVASCLRFCTVAEAFAGNRLATRDALMHILGAFVKGSHKSNMQALKHCLAVETWGAGSSQGSTAEGSSSSTTCSDVDATCLQQGLSSNAYLVCSYGGDGFISDYAEWLESGNPFRKQGRAVGGKLASVLHLP